jgi:hypothetical protein
MTVTTACSILLCIVQDTAIVVFAVRKAVVRGRGCSLVAALSRAQLWSSTRCDKYVVINVSTQGEQRTQRLFITLRDNVAS